MTEAELVQYFDYFLQNYQIQTQILRRDRKLYVMLNRPADVEMDYPFLTEAIVEQLNSLPLDGIQTVVLNSRIVGQTTPDWKTAVPLGVASPIPPPPPEPTSTAAAHPEGSEPRSRSQSGARSSPQRTSGRSSPETGRSVATSSRSDTSRSDTSRSDTSRSDRTPANTDRSGTTRSDTTARSTPTAAPQGSEPQPTPSDPTPPSPASSAAEAAVAQADLSSYCFVRNQLLIKTSLPDPAPEVAEAVQFFHHLSEEEKLEVAPLLVQFFKQPDTFDLEGLPEEHQAWLAKIQGLNEHKLKSVAVWLSRYCADADKALAQVNATLQVMTPSSPAASASATSASDPASDPASAPPGADPQAPHPTGAAASTGVPPRDATASTSTRAPGSSYRSPSGSQRPAQSKPPVWKQMALPVVGVCLVAALFFGGMWAGLFSGSSYCQQPANPTAEDTNRYDLCVLTSQMMGDSEMSRASLSAERLSPEQLQDLPYRCRQEAENFASLSFLWGDPVGGSYQVAEVMPGIYTLDLNQTFRGGARDSHRFGCVFRGTAGGSIALVDSDRLPEGWPRTRYSPSTASRMGEDGGGFSSFGPLFFLSLGGLGFAILAGLFLVNLVVTSLAFLQISRMGLGVSIYSLPALILGALVFSLWSGLFSFIPSVGLILGLVMDVIQDVFAMILAGSMVRGFKVDYTVGFPLLVLCVLILYAVRVLVYWVLFLVFGSMFMSMLL